MHLEKLTLQGFKSFAPKTEIKFGKGVTAIVGPNGSGKSNIADAIKWVLGEHGLKNIRGKKSLDVIFAGSKEKAKMGMAEISMALNNEDRKIDIDFPEVEITRRLYRNGDTEYLINNAPVRLMDIQDLLLKSGFGQRTYSVISQGQIDNILAASPASRKEMFDEAAGVKQYQIKRDSALRKLERTKQNLLRVSDLLRELKPRLRSLKKQAEKAEKSSILEKELKEKQIKLYTHLWFKFDTKLRETQKKLCEKKSVIERIQSELDAVTSKLNDNEKTSETSRKTLEALQKELGEAHNKQNQIQHDLTIAQGKIEIARERESGIDISGIKSEIERKTKSINEIKLKIEEKERTLEEISSEIKSKAEEQELLNKEIVEIQKGIQQAQIESMPANTEINFISQEFSDLFKEQESLTNKILNASTVKDIEEIKPLAKKLLSKLKSALEKIKRATGTKPIGETNILKLQARLNEKVDIREKLSFALNDLKVKKASLTAEKEAMERNKEIIEEDLKNLRKKMEQTDIAGGGESKFEASLKSKASELESALKTAEKEVSSQKLKLDEFNLRERETKSEIFKLERNYRNIQEELNQKRIEQNAIEIDRAKHETRKEDIVREMEEEIPKEYDLITKSSFSAEKILEKNEERDMHFSIEKIKRRLDIIGGIDPAVIEDFSKLDKRVGFLDRESKDLNEASLKLKEILKELNHKIQKQFDKAFSKINEQFKRFFKILFGGGEAKLSLIREQRIKVDPDDEKKKKTETVESIDIQAIPPGKKLRNITMLSGGEKALTSLALLFAIISNNPSPFIVLDEVDAALDEANSKRFGRILHNLRQDTQFVTITHNRETMKEAKILYGVTMERNGISKLLSVKLEEAEKAAVQSKNKIKSGI